MKPILFTIKLTIGKPWALALEHDPGTVTSSRVNGKPMRWTGAATRLFLGPVYACVVWGEKKA